MNTQTIPFPMLTRSVQRLMEQHVMKRLRFYAEHEAAKTAWYTQGDGRRVADGGKGYSFPHCIHGMSRHTDYDNICGPCEDGWGWWNPEHEIEEAFHLAVYSLKESARRSAIVLPLVRRENTMPTHLKEALFDWAASAVNI